MKNEELAAKILDILILKEQLKKLTNKELVRAALKSGCSDYEIVVEMMNRLYSGWENDVIRENESQKNS